MTRRLTEAEKARAQAARAEAARAQAIAHFRRMAADIEPMAESLHFQRVVEVSMDWARDSRAELPPSRWDANAPKPAPVLDLRDFHASDSGIGSDTRNMSEAEGVE